MPTLEDPNLEENQLEQADYGEPEQPAYAEPQRPLGIPVPDPPRLRPIPPLDQQQRMNGFAANGEPVSSGEFPIPNGGSSNPQGGRDYLERQNALTDPQSPAGQSALDGHGTDINQATAASSGSTYLKDQADRQMSDPRSRVVGGENTGLKRRLLGKNNEKLLSAVENTKAGQIASKATETYDKAKTAVNDIKSVGKLLATGGADIGSWLSLAKQHGLPLLKKYWKIIAAACVAAELPLILISLAIAISLGSFGNPAGGVAVSANTQYANARCSEMQSTLEYKKADGTADHLTLFATEGEFSKEDPYDVEKKKTGISLESYVSSDPASPHYFPDSWKPYYASGRWGYIASTFNFSSSRSVFPGLPSGSDYAGRKVIFYNPQNGKAAVAIAMDWGPNPNQTDTAHTTKSAEESLWNGSGSRNGYRIDNPPGDKFSLVGGASDAVANEIGAAEFTPVEMGFATDQTLDPTKPFTCTPVQNQSGIAPTVAGTGVQNDSAKDNDGTPHFVQNVPAVRQADGNDCNKASAAMVILHYDPAATGLTTTNAKGQLVNTDSSTCYASTAGALAKALGSQNITFSELQPSQVSADLFKKSIDAGDPVIISQHNLISSGPHFVVIVGYDNSRFYINDPFPWQGTESDTSQGTVHIYTDRGHNSPNPLLTQTALMKALYGGNTGGGYVAIIRNH